MIIDKHLLGCGGSFTYIYILLPPLYKFLDFGILCGKTYSMSRQTLVWMWLAILILHVANLFFLNGILYGQTYNMFRQTLVWK